MSDYYWQCATPTTLHLDFIYQVKYTVHPMTDNIFEVQQTNLYDNKTDHRVFLPQRYHDFLIKFLWRIAILIEVYQKHNKRTAKQYKEFLPRLSKILVHLDNVVEALIRPAVGLSLNESEKYRSWNFEEFLVTEFLLGRHEPMIVQEYRETYDINLERINLDELDWDVYDAERINEMLEGSRYQYDVENVTSKELGNLWKLAEEHYTRDIDHAWVSRWLDKIAKKEDGASAHMDVDCKDAGTTEDNDDSSNSEDAEEGPVTADDAAEDPEDAGDRGDEASDHVGCDENTEEGPEGDDDVAGDPRDAGDVVGDFSGDDAAQDVGGVPEDAVASRTEASQPSTRFIVSRNPNHPVNQLVQGMKRTRQEDLEEEEGEDMPPKKRSAMPVAPVQQGLIAFDQSLAFEHLLRE